jgi:hypothetical protein
MSIFDQLAEERIRAALARGELTGLEGEGRPLDLDEDPLIPAELRMSHRILRNAGCVPASVLAFKELARLRDESGDMALSGLERARRGVHLLALVQQLELQGLGHVAAALLRNKSKPGN